MTIYKYPLRVTDEQCVQLPGSARILAVQVQDGTPCLWALVDERRETEPRTIRTFGTGHPFDLPRDATHIGTYQLHGGGLVFHVFEASK